MFIRKRKRDNCKFLPAKYSNIDNYIDELYSDIFELYYLTHCFIFNTNKESWYIDNMELKIVKCKKTISHFKSVANKITRNNFF